MKKLSAVRVVSYNIHHARGLDNKVNLKRIAAVLAGCDAHLVGLQEVDSYHQRSYFSNQAKKLGKLLHNYHCYGANIKGLPFIKYGNAVLSRGPINNWQNYALPGRGEQRGLLWVEVEIDDTPVDFYCTHLGLNHQERLEQARAILEIISARGRPGILVGDFNDDRRSTEYKMLTSVLKDASWGCPNGGNIFGETTDLKTFPAGKPQKQIDFVLVTAHWQINKALAVNSQASDHLAVLAEINLSLPARVSEEGIRV